MKKRQLPAPNVGQRYLEALGERDPLESMRKAPKRVRKLVKGLSPKALARRVEPGKWSIKDVLAHLADGEMVLGTRIRLVAAMEKPTLVGYDQDAFVARLRYDEVEPDELLEAFAAVRALNVALLARLPDEDFARVGLHTERGEESLSTMVFMYAGHDRIHEEQIERLRAAARAAKRAPAAAPNKRRRKAK